MDYDTSNLAAVNFNSTLPGIEIADAVLIVGSHIRSEAPLVNVRLRKAVKRGAKVFVIGPVWGPWYYPPTYYYPPYYPPYQPIVIQRAPQVYIEQYVPPQEPVPAPERNNYWYYCAAAKAYYPYVNECPSGWQKVLPQPPAPQ